METQINNLKKNDQFEFNYEVFTVKQKYSDWKKDDEPYLITTTGQIFYHGELPVKKIN